MESLIIYLLINKMLVNINVLTSHQNHLFENVFMNNLHFRRNLQKCTTVNI